MNLVSRYVQWLKEHKLEGYAYPAVTLADIEAFEAAQGIFLPLELRALYLQLGGQEGEILNEVPYRLIPLAEIPAVQTYLLAQAEASFGNAWADFRWQNFEDSEAVRNVPFHEKRLPIFQNDNDDYYCLDFVPAESGVMGQVIAVRGKPSGDATDMLLVFDSFAACLEDIVEDLDNEVVQDMASFFAHTGEHLQQWGGRLSAQEAVGDYDAEIASHVMRTLAPVNAVLRDMGDGAQQVHIYHVAADDSRPFQVLLTSGMSCRPMFFSGTEDGDPRRAELLMLLPPDWPLQADDEAHTWPLQWLSILARLPHEQQVGLDFGAVIRLSDDATVTLPGTPFNSFVLLPPHSLPEAFARLQAADGEEIRFLALLPLYPAELALKEGEGLVALLARFTECGVTECVSLTRPNCVAQ